MMNPDRPTTKTGERQREKQRTPACCVLPDHEQVSRLAALAKALGDPIRLRMLALLVEGRSCCGLADAASRGVPGTSEPRGVCVCEFQEQFEIGQSKTSYHLRVLKDAGLVTEETRGKWSFYELDEAAAIAAFRELASLLKLDLARPKRAALTQESQTRASDADPDAGV